jgi:hypothetical protein
VDSKFVKKKLALKDRCSFVLANPVQDKLRAPMRTTIEIPSMRVLCFAQMNTLDK